VSWYFPELEYPYSLEVEEWFTLRQVLQILRRLVVPEEGHIFRRYILDGDTSLLSDIA